MNDPVIIVGASLGGLRTAESLRRCGYTGPIVVIGAEPHAPYNRPPLSKAGLADGVTHDEVAFVQRDATADVTWMLNTTVVSANLEKRSIVTDTGDSLSYRALIIATGLRPRRIAAADDDMPGRFALRTLDDARHLRRALTPGAHVVVAGAGFIGCEVAATARTLGCEVTVVGTDRAPMVRPLGIMMAAEMQRRHEARGVRFMMGRRVQSINGTDTVESVLLDDGTERECTVFVEAIGSRFNTEWLDGNDLDTQRGVSTDHALRALRADGSAWDDVYAVGDVARFPNALFGGIRRNVEHWNIPSETAKRVGEVLAAELSEAGNRDEIINRDFTPLPSFWSDQYDVHLLAYGMLDLADEIRLLHGSLDGECVVGYYRWADMVGVCGLGMRSKVIEYRSQLSMTR